MKKKLTIRIEVDPDAGEITVKDDAGNKRQLKSIVMFGGDANWWISGRQRTGNGARGINSQRSVVPFPYP
jgi:hypothetical protein